MVRSNVGCKGKHTTMTSEPRRGVCSSYQCLPDKHSHCLLALRSASHPVLLGSRACFQRNRQLVFSNPRLRRQAGLGQ